MNILELTNPQQERLCKNKPFLKTLDDMLEDEITQFSSKYDDTKRLGDIECTPTILISAINEYIGNKSNIIEKEITVRLNKMDELVKENLKVAGGKKTKKRNKKRNKKSRRRS
jgi:hypothetical protein